MSKPVIIFGAGASHDLVDISEAGFSSEHQPPLTKDLFHNKWERYLNRFELLKKLLPKIRENI